MKKVLLAIAMLFALGMSANAQLTHIGARFGGGQGYGAEVSTIWFNNIEADLGWSSYEGSSSFSLTGIYQIRGDMGSGFGWFLGAGAQVGMWNTPSDSGLNIAVAGQAGLEYNFAQLPLQLSLDIRPRLQLIPSTHFHWGDIAFGVRYRF